MGSVEKKLKSMLSKEEIKNSEELADLWMKGIQALRGSISHALDAEMKKQQLSFNALARALDLSENMTSKMLYGKGNITFDTIMHLAFLKGKIPFISWKDPDEVTDEDYPIVKKRIG